MFLGSQCEKKKSTGDFWEMKPGTPKWRRLTQFMLIIPLIWYFLLHPGFVQGDSSLGGSIKSLGIDDGGLFPITGDCGIRAIIAGERGPRVKSTSEKYLPDPCGWLGYGAGEVAKFKAFLSQMPSLAHGSCLCAERKFRLSFHTSFPLYWSLLLKTGQRSECQPQQGWLQWPDDESLGVAVCCTI